MDKMKNFVFSSETIEYNFYLLRTNSPWNKKLKFLKNMVTPTLGKNKKDSLNIENLM